MVAAGIIRAMTRSAVVPSLLCVCMLAACSVPTPGAPPPTVAAPTTPTAVPRRNTETKIPGGPTLLVNGIKARKVLDVGGVHIRMAHNMTTGELWILSAANDIFAIKPEGGAKTKVVGADEMGIPKGANASGMRFGPDGALYVVYNRKEGTANTRAVVLRGTPAADGRRIWGVAVKTVPYAASNTNFDHLFNGIAFSPDGRFMYLNSGSRTDHGEVQSANGAHFKVREVAMTTKIFKVPADARDLELPDDEAKLRTGGYIFAEGTRNAYDLAFAPNGDMFGVDNGPDADYPDELNWLREGRHYGFPWRFGNYDNPQQFENYDDSKDKFLNKDFVAVQRGTYSVDLTFPKPPGAFTGPVINNGPAATQYRKEDGGAGDAAKEGRSLATFTAHRSPLGLVFAHHADMPVDLRGSNERLSAMVLSWGSAGGTLTDRGQDLLHLWLTRNGDNYEAATTQLARDFKNPIDAVLLRSKLYVLEYAANGAIWELSFE
jgi:glucose/arabinose dehydrogenase